MKQKYIVTINGVTLVAGILNGKKFDGHGIPYLFTEEEKEQMEGIDGIEFQWAKPSEALTTEPSADVVERIIRKYLGSWQWFGTTVIPQEDMGRDPIKELSAIIEAEVERRVRNHENRQ